MIEERSAAKKKKREMEKKMKEVEKKKNKQEMNQKENDDAVDHPEKDHSWSKKYQRETDEEVDKPEEDHRPEGGGDDWTQDATGGAHNSTDFFHPQGDCSTSVKETSRQHLTSKELDKGAEV